MLCWLYSRWWVGECCQQRAIPSRCIGSIHLFPILPHNVMLYAVLRRAHTVLAYLLFLTFLAHFGAVLFHTWVVRDGTFSRMAPWRVAQASEFTQHGPTSLSMWGNRWLGGPGEVVDKILRHSEALGGFSRLSFMMNAASEIC